MNKDGQLLLRYVPFQGLTAEASLDPNLSAGFMSALQSFSLEQFQASLSQYIVGEFRYDISLQENIYLFAKSSKNLPEILLKKKENLLRRIGIRFLKEYASSLTAFSGEVSRYHNFRRIIDEILLISDPTLLTFLLPMEMIQDLLKDAPKEPTATIHFFLTNLFRVLSRYLDFEFQFYSVSQDDEGMWVRVLFWNQAEMFVASLKKSLDMEDTHFGWILHESSTLLSLHQRNDLRFYMGDFYYSQLSNASPSSSKMRSFHYSHKDEKRNLCKNCLKGEISEKITYCDTCGAYICNDKYCIERCTSCGVSLCPDCIYPCPICNKERLCWNCALLDLDSKNYVCYGCWDSSLTSNREREIGFAIKFKIARHYYFHKSFEKAARIYEGLLKKFEPQSKNHDLYEMELLRSFIVFNYASCLIEEQDFQRSLNLLKEIEVSPFSKLSFYWKRAYLSALSRCYAFFIETLGVKNPALAAHYQGLFSQIQSEMTVVNKAFKSSSHPDMQFCINSSWLIAQARPKTDVYYQYFRPLLCSLDSQDRAKENLPEISFSPFDMIDSIINELIFKLQLPLYAGFTLFTQGQELCPYTKLLNYQIDEDKPRIEFGFSPLCKFCNIFLGRF